MLKLTKTLFWDTDAKFLDYKKHRDFIIKRVLQHGDKVDYQQIKRFYGLVAIKKAARETRSLDKKSLNFWSVIFNIPKNKFLCFKKQSTTKRDLFWDY